MCITYRAALVQKWSDGKNNCQREATYCSSPTFWNDFSLKYINTLKFIYSEKATKFCVIFTLILTTVHTIKSKVKILQKFVAFSEYMNFKTYLPKNQNSKKNRQKFIKNWPKIIFQKIHRKESSKYLSKILSKKFVIKFVKNIVTPTSTKVTKENGVQFNKTKFGS